MNKSIDFEIDPRGLLPSGCINYMVGTWNEKKYQHNIRRLKDNKKRKFIIKAIFSTTLDFKNLGNMSFEKNEGNSFLIMKKGKSLSKLITPFCNISFNNNNEDKISLAICECMSTSTNKAKAIFFDSLNPFLI